VIPFGTKPCPFDPNFQTQLHLRVKLSPPHRTVVSPLRLAMMRPMFSRCATFRSAVPQISNSARGIWQSTRQYSIAPQAASDAKPLDIDPSKLVIEKTTKPGTLKKPEDLVFGRNFTGRASRCILWCGKLADSWDSRPHDHDRMEQDHRLACSSHHALPEPLVGPRDVRVPLCL